LELHKIERLKSYVKEDLVKLFYNQTKPKISKNFRINNILLNWEKKEKSFPGQSQLNGP
jgi:hypothetical protein